MIYEDREGVQREVKKNKITRNELRREGESVREGEHHKYMSLDGISTMTYI